MSDKDVEDIAEIVIEDMRPMTPAQRAHLMSWVMEVYCRHCGHEHSKSGICQCENEE